MATIDNLDMNVYRLYAVRTKMIEDINQQFRLEEASSIPPQTLVIDSLPKLSELDLLLGVVPYHTPWAYFFPPKEFMRLRRSSFAFSRVAPTLGTEEEEEEHLSQIACSSDEDKKEKEILSNCLKQIKKLNDWMGFIIGRVGQFLQG